MNAVGDVTARFLHAVKERRVSVGHGPIIFLWKAATRKGETGKKIVYQVVAVLCYLTENGVELLQPLGQKNSLSLRVVSFPVGLLMQSTFSMRLTHFRHSLSLFNLEDVIHRKLDSISSPDKVLPIEREKNPSTGENGYLARRKFETITKGQRNLRSLFFLRTAQFSKKRGL